MPTLRDTAAAWLAAREPAVVVEVAAAQGSVPREAGTRMLVSAAQCFGTVGGGHLEWKAIAKARDLLAQGDAAAHTEHYPLGPALGQCCGGAVTLTHTALNAEALARWQRTEFLLRLQLYGAGHVGRAIVHALAPLPVHVTWIDEREEEFAAATALGESAAAQVERVCVDTLEAEVRHALPGACYLVLTHQHDLDLRITEAILRRGDFAYLGLIGSKTKRQRFVHRFEERGLAAEAIARITCPIGVPGIDGKEPEVIAAAVVAQLLQQREARRAITRSADRPE